MGLKSLGSPPCCPPWPPPMDVSTSIAPYWTSYRRSVFFCTCNVCRMHKCHMHKLFHAALPAQQKYSSRVIVKEKISFFADGCRNWPLGHVLTGFRQQQLRLTTFRQKARTVFFKLNLRQTRKVNVSYLSTSENPAMVMVTHGFSTMFHSWLIYLRLLWGLMKEQDTEVESSYVRVFRWLLGDYV